MYRKILASANNKASGSRWEARGYSSNSLLVDKFGYGMLRNQRDKAAHVKCMERSLKPGDAGEILRAKAGAHVE